MTKEIQLTKGMVALVDDEDFEVLNKYNWFANYMSGTKTFRAVRNKSILLGGGMIYMHREIMNTPKNLEVDHINHDTLDNRKCNLRNATKSQNNMNKTAQSNNMSGYRGVHKVGKRYRAKIEKDGIVINIGYFADPKEAAKAYDKKARELFGDFVIPNFPEAL